MPSEPESNLHWTAFLYVSGDLAPDETSRFELRLADDQSARDAVIEAVGLTEAIALAGSRLRPRRRMGRLVLVAASAMAAAACLVLAFGPVWRAIQPAPLDPAEVARAWSSLRDADAEASAVPSGSPTVEAATVAEIDTESDGNSSADRALPSWLLTAASAPVVDEAREEN